MIAFTFFMYTALDIDNFTAEQHIKPFVI